MFIPNAYGVLSTQRIVIHHQKINDNVIGYALGTCVQRQPNDPFATLDKIYGLCPKSTRTIATKGIIYAPLHIQNNGPIL